MAQAPQDPDVDLTERFVQFYRKYYSDDIGRLAQRYPNEQRSLYVDYDDLFRFDEDLAEDYRKKPDQIREYAEEALRLYDLPVDVKLGRAHVRLHNLPDSVDIRNIRVHDDHIGRMVSVQGIVRKATDVRPKITEAAFECQRCGTMTYIPQTDSGFQEPHECQGCERQGPFHVDFDQSEFVDSQKLRVQESPEGLRGGETPQSIDIDTEDDITGRVTAGDHVVVTGVLHIEQQTSNQEKTPIFDLYMDGVAIEIEDEEFEDMDISEEDVAEIIELSNEEDIYEMMVGSVAPSIYGYEQEKLAMILQLFSGVTKHLPDGSRIRGDLHMLLIGDPGTGKCVAGDTRVTLADGSEVPIRELVERNLDDPKPVDDGVWDSVDFEVPSMAHDGSISTRRATKVWKREAPERMYDIRTASGRELTVTPSHPLFIGRDGGTDAVVAEDLEAGEFVAVPRSLPVEGDDSLDVSIRRSRSPNAVRMDLPDRLTPSLARLLGYVAAEGYVDRRDSGSAFVSVTNNDREILDDALDALDGLGLSATERTPHDGKSARELICSSSELVSFLEELEPAFLAGSSEQRVPEPILRSTRPVKRGFLKAFVDAEGTVSPSQREVTVSSTSRDVLEGVRSLLLAFGVDSQLRPKAGGSFRLRISGDDFARYVERVGFVTERKSEAAAATVDADGNTNRDVVPSVGETLRDLRESLGLTQADCGLPRSTYQHYERGDRNPSRDSLRTVVRTFTEASNDGLATDGDGGASVERRLASLRALADGDVAWDRVESIESVESEDEWVYDLEIEGTHNFLTNNVVSHNSQMLQYIRNIAPRSVYTSGKGSSSAGLTAAAVRDDFGDGQQWTLEAGALVLADKGIAAVDELDKMRPEDRSAMHEGLEQQQISVSKAGINATLKARCSLLGAANPKYGRFDQYESIGEQIDLEPALISRFDLIFTVTDTPDPDTDAELAEHIINTNYAGELHTQRTKIANSEFTEDEVNSVTQEVAPVIDAELLRKYIAYAKRNCYPTMTQEAKETIRDFYVNFRAKGSDEDSPIPVTARKLEALVRLAEASARVRLSDSVTQEDAVRVTNIVESCLRDIGMDPETGEFDADIVETGTSKNQRDRIKNLKALINELEDEYEGGAPVDEVLARAEAELDLGEGKAEQEIESLRRKGEVYEPRTDHLRTT
ncbi:cell division control protein 21 [Halogeometricum pallidum JCM 14848]|uniref:DNA helicase n=1 Tax=Halogeometricum pallidum JCM 14848 TaxID=1227487 RepID=M0D6S0_HALPD|nr:LAGLIDADG family homing endonuclease [Halogeometricum pallidum]ELZ30392.1 cell division control protein 21 [Halogeometricum pallidum JCM 14848]